MIVTIDGPAGAGKSSAARSLAKRLGFRFLDTGAMYRAVAWAANRQQIQPENHREIVQLAESLRIEFRGDSILLDGVDVTEAIRRPEISQIASAVATIGPIREILVREQRDIARDGNYVCEGRDQGTVAFPDAACKIFLTASAQERARRRRGQLETSGKSVSLDETIREQHERDHRDRTRMVGRLEKAADAVEVVTDGKTLEQVVDELELIVRNAIPETEIPSDQNADPR